MASREQASATDENSSGSDAVEQDQTAPTAVQEHVAQIWDRARSNAFAHRYAAESYRRRAATFFVLQVVFGISGVLFVLGVYIVSSSEMLVYFDRELDVIILTFLSVVFSITSLFFSIIQNYLGYEKLEQLHDHNQHSFLSIAQRAREVRFPEIGKGRSLEILQDLERDFQILKARGKEPSNKHFQRGDELLTKVKTGPSRKRQSFLRLDNDRPK